jgi:hypothetical protein
MTYSHALRYLTAPDAPTQAPGIPPLTVKWPHTPLLLCFTRNKLGSAASCMVASILKQAGVSYLHWIDDDALDPKCRFLMDGRPISPPLLSHHAGLWQAAARAEGRDLTRAERCGGVLSACAAAQDCRVILLESPLSVCHIGYFGAINKKIRAITLLSDGKTVARTAQNPATVEIITPAYGRTMHSRITDICAQNDCKMVPIAATAIQRTDVAPGGQTIVHQTRDDKQAYRLASGSQLAADAAAMALYCIRSLTEQGLSISEWAVESGLMTAAPAHCGSVYSLQPLILTHSATDEQELALVRSDIDTLTSSMSTPPIIWLEPALVPFAPAFDALPLYREDTWPSDTGLSLLLVGSHAWIEDKLRTRKQKKAKNNDKI